MHQKDLKVQLQSIIKSINYNFKKEKILLIQIELRREDILKTLNIKITFHQENKVHKIHNQHQKTKHGWRNGLTILPNTDLDIFSQMVQLEFSSMTPQKSSLMLMDKNSTTLREGLIESTLFNHILWMIIPQSYRRRLLFYSISVPISMMIKRKTKENKLIKMETV